MRWCLGLMRSRRLLTIQSKVRPLDQSSDLVVLRSANHGQAVKRRYPPATRLVFSILKGRSRGGWDH